MKVPDWRIAYNERPLGVGVHGVIEIYDDKGKLQHSFEGLSADSSGKKMKPIGSAKFGDIIKSQVLDSRFKSGNALEKPENATTVYVGSQTAVESVVRAMTVASKAIDEKKIPYQLPLVDSGFSAPTNSNSCIATMFAVMGLKKPPPITGTAMGQVGAGKLLLDPDEIAGFHGMIGQAENRNVPLPPIRPSAEIDGIGKQSMNETAPANVPSQPFYLRMPEMARKLYP
ncbi:hypothetical protein [Labrys sp. ZIDIC5]|uniref:hypothetical protein n=1 Tax=Labrys sedimenti TaxID=3106036 RepID=UPI002ACAFE27|nr:hypothetical protein [Labrys sp. ZIDIC5]MDZ5450046.1 hypothetical protein [Labrys sp. ZIDIC5]